MLDNILRNRNFTGKGKLSVFIEENKILIWVTRCTAIVFIFLRPFASAGGIVD